MAAPGWFRGRSFELIHTRSVFVRVNPTPTNLSERRAVLHALQRHGTVEVFKRLPAPSTFICAFVNRNEAVDILQKSPVTFKFVSEPLGSIQSNAAPGVNSVGVAAPIELHFVKDESNTVKREQTDPSLAQSDPIKTFTLWTQPSESRYNHKTNIRRNPIHGRWPEVQKPDLDFVYYALKETIPESIAQHGLCDWVTGGQLSEDVKLARADEGNGGNWQIRDRIERRRNREKLMADEHELTSWTSIKQALHQRSDAFTEAFESAYKATDEAVGDSDGSETTSGPLRTNDPLSQAGDKQPLSWEGEDSPSGQAPASDHQNDIGGSMAESVSKEALQKLMEMPTSSKVAPTLDSSFERLGSKSSDQGEKQ